MKRLVILAAALAAVAMPAQAADYAWPVVRVIDGDTIVVDASADLPPELADLRVRLRGVDAPEKGHRAACDAEREAADGVTAVVAKVLDAAETIVVRNPEWGKWGGRVVADVILDGEHSLPELLAKYGHARRDGSLLADLGWCGGDRFSTAAAWEECTAAPDDAARLACYDRAIETRQAGDDTAAPRDARREVERFVVEPCVAIAYREWRAAAGDGAGVVDADALVDTMLRAGEPAMLARVMLRAGRFVDQLTAALEPILAGAPPALRLDTYDVFRRLCIAEARKRMG